MEDHNPIDQYERHPDDKDSHITIPKRRVIIEPVICMYFIAMSPIFIVGKQYIYSRVAEDHGFKFDSRGETSDCAVNHSSPEYQKEKAVQEVTSHWLLILEVAITVPSIFSTVIIGAYSDKAGRKIAFIAPIIGCFLRAITYMVVVYFKLPLHWLILSSVFEGLAGSTGSAILSCYAYACDVSTVENRSFRITMMEISIGIGNAIAVGSTGPLIKATGYVVPYVIITGVHLVNLTYAYFFVPETVKKQPDAKFFTLNHFKVTFKLYVKDNGTKRRWKLIILLVVFFFCEMVIAGSTGTQALKLLKSPLCFNSVLFGLYRAAHVLSMQTGTMIAVKLFQKRVSDVWFAFFGCFGGMATNIFFGFANTRLLIFMVAIVAFTGNMVLPMVRSMMSKLVQPLEQGSLFASQASIRALCVLTSQFMFTATYAATLGIWSGTAFMLMAGNNLIALVVIILYMVLIKREMKKETKDPSQILLKYNQ
ncbi:unnamed protein product [Owenia fusiformis]|uniref:Uncharacterized protein n=1 Tax=Owenia fusiformis TaxID=6347 RepID=A0A8J1XWN7_OWEFU|nr:unnamed protein product [Owenia fusiformis]